jgi:hypothetical protein
MYEIMIKLMVAAALLQLGMTLSKPKDIASRSGMARIERASRQVLHVDWKPISVFPEEAKRFAGQ